MTYNKLVRDKIPEIILKSGHQCITEVASEETIMHYLMTKLDEEIQEFKDDQLLEELADILEVVIGLAQHLGYTESDLFQKRNEKKATHGSFSKQIILKEVIK